MSNDLSFDEKMSSMENIKEFRRYLNENEYNFNVRVFVLDKNENEIYDSPKISITIEDGDICKISINWEDYGLENFKDFDLLGQYWSTTTRVNFEKRQLILKHRNSDKTVILY